MLRLLKGEIIEREPTLVRVHSECLTGDVFGSHRCDCGPQLHAALHKLKKQVVVFFYICGKKAEELV